MMFSIVYLIIILVGLVGANFVFQKYPKAAILAFCALPVLLTPMWIMGTSHLIFTWGKLYSIVLFNILILLFRYTKLSEKKYAKVLLYIALAINITEASVQDLSMMQLPNILNAVAGFLLIFATPGWKNIKVDKSSTKDFVWPEISSFWIFAYVIWNWTFVYLDFPEHAGYHIVILLASVIPALFKRELWLQARVFTLGIWMIYFFSFFDFILKNALILPRNDSSMLVVGLVSLVLNFVNFILSVKLRSIQSVENRELATEQIES